MILKPLYLLKLSIKKMHGTFEYIVFDSLLIYGFNNRLYESMHFKEVLVKVVGSFSYNKTH